MLSTVPAVNSLGCSQGGEFLRSYVELCNTLRVAALVTFGSSHAGVADFKDRAAGNWLCLGALVLLRRTTWSALVQARVVSTVSNCQVWPCNSCVCWVSR